MNTVAQRHFAPQAATQLPTGATACAGYQAPRLLGSGALQTCTGQVIGGAIARPLPPVTQDGARIQDALLAHPHHLPPTSTCSHRWAASLLAHLAMTVACVAGVVLIVLLAPSP